MAHEAPADESTKDATNRSLRTLVQGLAVTLVVGAATGVYQLVEGGDALSWGTVLTAAGTGALMAGVAWIQRKAGK